VDLSVDANVLEKNTFSTLGADYFVFTLKISDVAGFDSIFIRYLFTEMQ
jgi:hypothetical protein